MARGSLRVELAGGGELVPGAVVFGSANPYVEVGVDPRAGDEAVELAEVFIFRAAIASRMVTGSICGFVLEGVVEAAEELASVLRIRLPGVLAVEDDGDHGIVSAVEHRPGGGRMLCMRCWAASAAGIP